MSTAEYKDGVLRILWDDETRLRHTYDANGVEVGEPTPYTPEENAFTDAGLSEENISTNRHTIRAKAAAALLKNIEDAAQLKTFSEGTAALTNTQRDNAIRQSAGHLSRIFKQLNALIKLELNDLGDTTGTE